MNAIEIRGLVKDYGTFCLGPLDLVLPTGCILGLAGENGAGKSTLIRCILGSARTGAGEISVLGRSGRDCLTETKQDLGIVQDNIGLPQSLTPKQLNAVMTRFYRNWSADAFFGYLARFRLPENKRFKDFSRGMRMKLGIAVALSHAPKLLILDEATSGLDPVVRDEIVDLLYEFTRDTQHSILIASHILSDLEKLCDYIAFLQNGQLLLCEEKDALLERYGLVHCTREQLAALDPAVIVSEKHSAYGAQAVLRRADIPAGMEVSPIGMEELFLALVKGGRST